MQTDNSADQVSHYIDEYGDEVWKFRGRLHRDDGPASIRRSGTQIWYQHGKKHRVDGPAVAWADGSYSWYINDRHVSLDEYCKSEKLDLSTELILELKLKYG